LASILQSSCGEILPEPLTDILVAYSSSMLNESGTENLISILLIVARCKSGEIFNTLLSLVDLLPRRIVEQASEPLSTSVDNYIEPYPLGIDLESSLFEIFCRPREKFKLQLAFIRIKHFLDMIDEDTKCFEEIVLQSAPFLKIYIKLSLFGVSRLYSICSGSKIDSLVSLKKLILILLSDQSFMGIEVIVKRINEDIAILKRLQRISDIRGINAKILLLAGIFILRLLLFTIYFFITNFI
jgi:hypothetical protein